jgi:hypothetical protein
MAQSGERTSSNRHNASVKIAVGPSGLSKLIFVVNLRNSGAAWITALQYTGSFQHHGAELQLHTVSVQLNEMPWVQWSISSSTRLLLLDSLLDLFCHIIS